MMLPFRAQNNQGFTLIELMVVLVIAGLLASLTGGMMIESVAKQERLVEIEKVKQIFRSLNYKAFYSGYDMRVTLDENRLTVTGGDIQEQIVFNQLAFQQQQFLISTQAYIEPGAFYVKWRDDYQKIEIPELFIEIESLDN